MVLMEPSSTVADKRPASLNICYIMFNYYHDSIGSGII